MPLTDDEKEAAAITYVKKALESHEAKGFLAKGMTGIVATHLVQLVKVAFELQPEQQIEGPIGDATMER